MRPSFTNNDIAINETQELNRCPFKLGKLR